uniref:Uncharacterized protein n=1 Tax=Anopheles christyi TaxID=43041 RepID=A0A182KIM2_9DIPT
MLSSSSGSVVREGGSIDKGRPSISAGSSNCITFFGLTLLRLLLLMLRLLFSRSCSGSGVFSLLGSPLHRAPRAVMLLVSILLFTMSAVTIAAAVVVAVASLPISYSSNNSASLSSDRLANDVLSEARGLLLCHHCPSLLCHCHHHHPKSTRSGTMRKMRVTMRTASCCHRRRLRAGQLSRPRPER